MRRRTFIALLPGLAVLNAQAAMAQKSGQPRRIAIIMGFPEGDPIGQSNIHTLREELARLGWIENQNLQIDDRWPAGDPEKARSAAAEVIDTAPSLILTSTNQVTDIVRRQTQTIPIVFASLGDPIGSGLVNS